MEETKKKIIILTGIVIIVIVLYIIFYTATLSFGPESACVHDIIFEENVNGFGVELLVTGFDQHGDIYPEFHSTSNYRIMVTSGNDTVVLNLNETQYYVWSNSTNFFYEDTNDNQIVDENDTFFLMTEIGKTIELEIFFIPHDITLKTYSWSPATP